jgi:hypothetical protein
MAYCSSMRLGLWLLVAFLLLLAFAAIGDQWIGYVRVLRGGVMDDDLQEKAMKEKSRLFDSLSLFYANIRANTSRFLPTLPTSDPQAVFIALLIIYLIVDAMFSNEQDFLFEPSITNYARSQSRRDD